MSVKFEVLISLLSITILTTVFSPILIFLEDIGTGKIYADFQFISNKLKINIHNDGVSYLKGINYTVLVKYVDNSETIKTGYIDKFAKGDIITIEVNLSLSFLNIKDIKIYVEAYIFGIYKISFEINKIQ